MDSSRNFFRVPASVGCHGRTANALAMFMVARFSLIQTSQRKFITNFRHSAKPQSWFLQQLSALDVFDSETASMTYATIHQGV